MSDNTELDSGLSCLISVMHFLGISGDAAQFRHDMGKEHLKFTSEDILRIAKQKDLKAKRKHFKFSYFKKVPFPAIAEARDGSYFIVVKAEDDKLLAMLPGQNQPEMYDQEAFEGVATGFLLLITSRAQIAGAARKFDVSWFIPAIVRYRKLLGEVIVASFFIQILALMTPLFFQVVIDKVLVHNGISTLDVMAIGLISVAVFEVIMGGLRTYLFSHTTNRIDVELGAKLFKHLLALPLAYFETRRVGDSVARVRELENIRNFLTSSSITVLIDLFFTFVFLGVMYFYSPFLLVVVLASLPLYVVISVFITPVLRNRLDEKFKRGAENQAFLVESVTGIETMKALAVEPQAQRRWEEQLAGYVGASFKADMLGNIGSQAVQFINKASTVAILFFGANLVMAGELSIGQLIAFNMLAGRVAMPVLRLAQLWQDFQQVRISVERLGDILNTPTEPQNQGGRTNLPKVKGNITFDHVTFRYQANGPEVLKDINLEIKAGEMIGIAGPSGSGKSTLTKLIQRLYIQEAGRVLVDGVDMALMDPSWLRRQVGVVLQENLLFNRTVRENIALTDPTRDIQQVMAAAEMAGAHEFITKMPEGYDSIIDERGANLSGGQRQRIAIARALITNPRVLIFDEATSALDAESEAIIRKNMKAISHGRTVIIIAHRLSALNLCDRIITMEEGRITEEGTHDELLEMNGRYASLWGHQVGMQMSGTE